MLFVEEISFNYTYEEQNRYNTEQRDQTCAFFDLEKVNLIYIISKTL